MEQRKTEEKQELTPQMLGMYLGQTLTVDAKNGEFTTGKIVSVDIAGGFEIECDKYAFSQWRIKGCDIKLILRPLSDMSEKEQKEVAELAMLLGLGKMYHDPEQIVKMYAHVTKYLLSRGFDLGIIPAEYVIHKTNSK